MKHWVFLFPTVPLGCLSICLPVCYCIRGTLASAMLNNASHLAKSLLALRQSRRSQRRAWIQETMSRDFSPVKWNLNSELQVIREENTETTWNTAVQCWCLSYFHLKFPPYSFFFSTPWMLCGSAPENGRYTVFTKQISIQKNHVEILSKTIALSFHQCQWRFSEFYNFVNYIIS